jgi:colanic acid/amylovoran biosynthesis glycosyltransferase
MLTPTIVLAALCLVNPVGVVRGIKELRMKLIYITVAMPFGTGESFLIPEATEILRQGHEMLIVPRSPRDAIFHKDAEALVESTITEPLVSWAIMRTSVAVFVRHPLLTIRAFILLLSSRNPTVFIKNLVVFPKALWLADVARAFGAMHIHAHWASTTATMAMVASCVSGIPWSFTSHRGDILENNLLRRKLKRSRMARFISQDGFQLATAISKGRFMERATVLRVGVSPPENIPQDHTLHKPPKGICPAVLIPRKGHKYLLEAVRILKDRGIAITIVLAGSGMLRSGIQELIPQLGIEQQVTLIDTVPHERLLSMYATNEVDFVVLATLHEGIPVVLMEAMSYGIPVVASDVGGIKELLGEGAGLVVPRQDSAALADELERLLTDDGLRSLLRNNGRNRVLNHYAVHDVVSTLLKQLESTPGTPSSLHQGA